MWWSNSKASGEIEIKYNLVAERRRMSLFSWEYFSSKNLESFREFVF